jgi:hypothetical protein
MKYYVITGPEDPGSEHETYEEAREVCVELQKYGTAWILGPDIGYYDPEDYDRYMG